MKKRLKPKDIRNIVIFRTDRIGEVLLTTPVIDALKANFLEAKISFVTSSYARDVISGRRDLEEIFVFSTIGRKVSLWKALHLSRKLRSRNFDMAIILNPHKVLHLAAFLAGVRYRVGFGRKWGILLNRKMKDARHKGEMHELNYNLRLLETIGIKERDITPSVDILDEERDYIEALFSRFDIDWDRKIVVVHPGSSNHAKRWPVHNFTELVRRLISRGNLNIVLIGDKSERAICGKIVKGAGHSRVFNLAGLLTLKQLAALFKWADLMITNDNGPMHIAAAVGRKVIAMFGRNMPGVSPTRWGPFGKGHIIFHKNPGCSPCYDKDCLYGFKCLTSITPEEVYEAARGILK